MAENENEGGSRFSKFLIVTFSILGGISIVSSIIVPIKIKNYYKPITKDYKTIADLSGIGDYIGGTTVALLTAASVFLLLATIIMQRMEIKISQKGIDQLVEQTKASIQQADDAREEVEITNKTMKHQQFDSTFFNMMNLHHTILENLKVDSAEDLRIKSSSNLKAEGREVITRLYDEFEDLAQEEYKEFKFNQYLTDEEIKGFSNTAYQKHEKEELLRKVELNKITGGFNKVKGEYEFLITQIENGVRDFPDYGDLQRIVSKPLNSLSLNRGEYFNLRSELLRFSKRHDIEYMHLKLGNDFVFEASDEWEEAKVNSYENFYKQFEHILGHYYRNLYRIIKYINESDMIDDLSKKEFRGILRAQLSSHELMMLFYNVMYSVKGEKFNNQLKNKNFFDDHLIFDDFVWNDDMKKLEE